jgi:hypothetical protein
MSANPSPSVRALRIASPAPELPELDARSPASMAAAMYRVLEAIAPLPSDSAKMRVLAAASTVYGADDDAAWFLDAAREIKGFRCARCGTPRR